MDSSSSAVELGGKSNTVLLERILRSAGFTRAKDKKLFYDVFFDDDLLPVPERNQDVPALPSVFREDTAKYERFLTKQRDIFKNCEEENQLMKVLSDRRKDHHHHYRGSILNHRDVLNSQPLGTGGFAKVYEVQNTKFALKCIARTTFPDGSEWARKENIGGGRDQVRFPSPTQRSFVSERKILRIIRDEPRSGQDRRIKFIKLNHIIQLKGSLTDQHHFCLLLWPFASCNLEDLLKDYGQMETKDPTKTKWLSNSFGCLAAAVWFLHSSNIRHKDIKPKNILITSDGRICICDFGTAADTHEVPHHSAETRGAPTHLSEMHIAPERKHWDYEDTTRDYPEDMYLLGLVFLEMATVLGGKDLKDLDDFLKDKWILEESKIENKATDDYKHGDPLYSQKNGLDFVPVRKQPCSLETIRDWLEGLGLPQKDDVKLWIEILLSKKPNDRWTAEELVINIQEVLHAGLFCDQCQAIFQEQQDLRVSQLRESRNRIKIGGKEISRFKWLELTRWDANQEVFNQANQSQNLKFWQFQYDSRPQDPQRFINIIQTSIFERYVSLSSGSSWRCDQPRLSSWLTIAGIKLKQHKKTDRHRLTLEWSDFNQVVKKPEAKRDKGSSFLHNYWRGFDICRPSNSLEIDLTSSKDAEEIRNIILSVSPERKSPRDGSTYSCRDLALSDRFRIQQIILAEPLQLWPSQRSPSAPSNKTYENVDNKFVVEIVFLICCREYVGEEEEDFEEWKCKLYHLPKGKYKLDIRGLKVQAQVPENRQGQENQEHVYRWNLEGLHEFDYLNATREQGGQPDFQRLIDREKGYSSLPSDLQFTSSVEGILQEPENSPDSIADGIPGQLVVLQEIVGWKVLMLCIVKFKPIKKIRRSKIEEAVLILWQSTGSGHSELRISFRRTSDNVPVGSQWCHGRVGNKPTGDAQESKLKVTIVMFCYQDAEFLYPNGFHSTKQCTETLEVYFYHKSQWDHITSMKVK